MDEKWLSPLFPIGGEGAVITNDWCINKLTVGKQKMISKFYVHIDRSTLTFLIKLLPVLLM